MTEARALRRIASAAAGVVLLACAHGCHSSSEPSDPGKGEPRLILDYARFQSDVLPVLERHGCDAGGNCHGGGVQGTYVLSPRDRKDPAFDFAQTTMQVSPLDRPRSPLLTKPLADSAGGEPHGVKVFASTEDSDYVAILGWIEAGELIEEGEP